MAGSDTRKDEDLLEEARDAFDAAEQAEHENREAAREDIRFARLDEQWPERVRKDRETQFRPCLTINKLPPFIRQVVNDARQNKPAIVVHPVDDDSDPHVAEIFNGLIRHIEQSSDAEVAYDTALDFAVTGGFGYFRINTRYCRDDGFDQELCFERVADPMTVYGDPASTAADSSDWNKAFVTDSITRDNFELQYKGAEAVDWESDYRGCGSSWLDGDRVTVAEYWTRKDDTKTIVLLSDQSVVDEDVYEAEKELYDALGVTVVGSRDAPCHKVKLHKITGAEVLETREWGGKFIPIVPVYGEELFVEGKRRLRGIVRGAKDSQRNFNYWRSAATEAVALAPLAPWVGAKGSFASDKRKWSTANNFPHAFLEYDPVVKDGVPISPPQRQPMASIPAGALQEAMNASDDMKAVMGLFDASIGAPSNETSGKAIMARQREGDVSTFHFLDNQSRAIRHGGRILLDLIPKVYNTPRVLRLLGTDGKPQMARVNTPMQMPAGADPHTGEMKYVEKIYDLTTGRYDLVVKTGPAFSTRREEFVNLATQIIQAFPQSTPLLIDKIVESFDLPGGEELAERFKAMLPPQAQGQDPKMDEAKQAIQQLQGKLGEMQNELKASQNDTALQKEKLAVDLFNAQTNRMKVQGGIEDTQLPQRVQQLEGLLSQLLGSGVPQAA